MSVFRRVAVIAGYEWRRAIAKKKVLALIILGIVFETLVIVAAYEVYRSGSAPASFGEVGLVWIEAVLVLESVFFVQFIAIIVGGGSMSEEYEHGTADILLSKPVTRSEYIFGKFLGGLSLLAMFEALTTFVGVVLSLVFFGAQSDLQFAPLMFLAVVYSSLIFYCLSFMFSELFRGTTLAILLALAVLIASPIISSILAPLNISTRALPTWAATSFPSLLISELVTEPSVLSAADTGALFQATLIIALYAIVFMLIAAYRLLKSDVTKKTG
jgi:ABC-2 type transport system permease protein